MGRNMDFGFGALIEGLGCAILALFGVVVVLSITLAVVVMT